MNWLEKLPWWAKGAFILGGFLLSAFSDRLPEAWQDVGIWLGIGLIIIGLVAVLGHFVSRVAAALSRHINRRSIRGLKNTMRGSSMLPIVGVAVSGILFVLCVAWLLASNHSTNAELQNTLRRYVLPRHLSEEQMTVIAEHLKQYPPHKFRMKISKDNSEVEGYAFDIRMAFERGGWEAVAFDYSTDVREGITYDLREPNPRPQLTAAEERQLPHRLFQEALRTAKVQVRGGSSGTANPMPPVALTVIVGPRPMSDADLVARKEEEEQARRLLSGEAD